MAEKEHGTRKTNKAVVWVILAILAVVGIPPTVCYVVPSTISFPSESPPYYPMEHVRASAPQWTPDGSRIIFAHQGSIYAVNQDGSSLVRIHGSGDANDVQSCPSVFRDGSRIAYWKFQGGDYEYNEEWSWMNSALDGSDVREVAENFDVREFSDPCSLESISPDGSRVAFTRAESRGPDGVDAVVLYVNEYPREVGDFGVELALGGDINSSPKWSPDGSQLAFVKWDYVPGEDGLYSWQVMALSGSDLGTIHQIADGFLEYGGWRRGRRVDVYELDWSPDGSKLLISALNSISVVNADGSDLRTLVNLRYLGGLRQLSMSWSPDGSKIAVYNGGGYEGALFTMSPDGSNKRVLTQYGNPLRPAQNQAWDSAYDAPTPNPTPASP